MTTKNTFKPYPSIPAFKNMRTAIKKLHKPVFSHLEEVDGVKTPVFTSEGSELPVLEFTGTVKLHGTNACVSISKHAINAQSRTRTLTTESDNAGFCQYVELDLMSKLTRLQDFYFHETEMYELENPPTCLHIFGEWCGGNIQSNCALVGVEKQFIVFDVLREMEDGSEDWIVPEIVQSFAEFIQLKSTHDLPTWNVTIDMNDPDLSEVDALRDEIDVMCPAAKALGSTSKNTVGEGNVWRCVTEGYTNFAFKHKGSSHQRKGPKVAKVFLVEELTETQMEAYENFIHKAASTDRMAQGIEALVESGIEEPSMQNTRQYLDWFNADVSKECGLELQALYDCAVNIPEAKRSATQMAISYFKAALGL